VIFSVRLRNLKGEENCCDLSHINCDSSVFSS
jgi:hypothetical protein